VLSASALIAGISASRGISKATHGDITEALQHFREHPAEPSTIFVNDPGISLAAYLSAKVERIRADHPTDMKGQDGDYIVLVPRRLDRSGNRIEWGHQMLNQANELAALGRAAVVLKSHKTLILRLRKLTPKQATTPPR
jgi:hypothetical protein